jgi:rare lipoprotein A
VRDDFTAELLYAAMAFHPVKPALTVILVPTLVLSMWTASLSTYASAAEPALALSTDVLSAGPQGGATHVLVSIDEPAASVATQNATPAASGPGSVADTEQDTGFDAGAVDLATVSLGAILQTGTASWYGTAWTGRRTAGGTRFNPEAMTAASHTLPLGTRVLVTLEGTARSVLVTITDRAAAAHRIIDLSKAAARKLGLLGRGTGWVILRRA